MHKMCIGDWGRAFDERIRGNSGLAAASGAAGLSQTELARHAYVRSIEPPFDAEMVAEEG